ncbi:MAG: tRNA (adenosine(37)-N6)-threonylcarbamoyltransferase complex dimerization subunit type 1 TsaB [Betaproteobacteria bacterium]
MATLDRMNPVLLAFDTSTEALAVALQWAGGQLVWNGEGGAQASARLLPTVQQFLGDAGLELAGVDAIAFGQGPGAFTGLRTACAVAQGLAFGADKPVLAVDSLLIVAEDERACQGFPPVLEVAVAMDARMGELYAARYRWTAQSWQVLQAPGLWDPQAWAAACRSVAGADQGRAHQLVWTGSGLPLLGDAHTGSGELQPVAVAPGFYPGRLHCEDRAAALLRLAGQAWHAGQALPAEQALPVYLRDKVALTTAERLARNAAAPRVQDRAGSAAPGGTP